MGQRRRRPSVAEPLDAGHARRAPSRPRSISAALRRGFARSTSTPAHAAPKPTHAGTFSMPAAPRPLLRAADERAARTRSPRRTSSAPAPFGPPSLCAVTEQRSAPSAREVDRDVARGRARVDVHERRRARARAAHTSAAGCSVPTSWFASCTRHERRVGAHARRSPRRRRSARVGRRRRRSPRRRSACDRVAHARVLDRGRHDVAGPCDRAARARPTPRCSPPRCPTT